MSTAPNSELYTQLQYENNGNGDGAILGQSATDKIAFYGKVPLAQRTPIAAVVGGYATTAYTTSATANTSATGTNQALALVTNSATGVLGNWTTLAASSISVGTSTYSVTATVNGYTATNTLLNVASATSINSVQAAVLNEVVMTLMGLGIWKTT